MSDDGNNGGGAPATTRPQQPLVIISQGGPNSSASRRIVRAQAARASAAQSRVTRQRNREEREGTATLGPHSPVAREPTVTPQPQTPVSLHRIPAPPSAIPNVFAPINPFSPASSFVPGCLPEFPQRPLVSWLTSLLNLNPTEVLQGTVTLKSPEPAVRAVSSSLAAVGSLPFSFASGIFQAATEGDAGFKLPVGLPRGFAGLQNRIQISDKILDLLSRTACIDFHSPGLEFRVHRLLFDIILTSAGTALSPIPTFGHPIQGHLRVACTCLTIFQGQRADGAVFAKDNKYKNGLDAAWSEVTLLDQGPLIDGKAAEASLWAMFIISVTTGATAQFFSHHLLGLFRDLQLTMWEQVRRVLLDFIYPASSLDEPCKSFYQTLHSGMLAGTV